MIDFFLKGGFLMYPIFFCSLAGLALLINKFLQYKRILKELGSPLKEIPGAKPAILVPLLTALQNGSNEKECGGKRPPEGRVRLDCLVPCPSGARAAGSHRLPPHSLPSEAREGIISYRNTSGERG